VAKKVGRCYLVYERPTLFAHRADVARAVRSDRSCRMGPHDGGQPARHLARELRGDSTHAQAALRQDHQHQLGHRLQGLREPHPLRHVQGGILGFTKTLAQELGKDNICVNCVAPGSTLSEENPDEALVKYRQAAASSRALQRLQRPEDLVGAVVFFASSDSDFITGQTLVVDGGACMH